MHVVHFSTCHMPHTLHSVVTRKEPSYLIGAYSQTKCTYTKAKKECCVSMVTTWPTIDSAQPGYRLETDKGYPVLTRQKAGESCNKFVSIS